MQLEHTDKLVVYLPSTVNKLDSLKFISSTTKANTIVNLKILDFFNIKLLVHASLKGPLILCCDYLYNLNC